VPFVLRERINDEGLFQTFLRGSICKLFFFVQMIGQVFIELLKSFIVLGDPHIFFLNAIAEINAHCDLQPMLFAEADEIKAGIPSHVSADLNAPAQLTNAELRERMSGNICRCGAYSNIAEAITEVAGRQA